MVAARSHAGIEAPSRRPDPPARRPQTTPSRFFLAGNRALARRLAPAPLGLYRKPDESPSRVRFPTLEVWAITHGGDLATEGRTLSALERVMAKAVFHSAVDLDAVRIVESTVAAAPTTLGNYIRIPPREKLENWVLIHELTHVWQYQTEGARYISDSLWHQAGAIVSSGSRHAAGQLTVVPGKSIRDYTAEQQAVIVTEYFRDPSFASDPEVIRMIGEVRAGKRLSSSFIFNEAAYGTAMGTEGRRTTLPVAPASFTETPGLPLIRWEF